MTTRVQMIVGGKVATVPQEHASKIAKKELLVSRAKVLLDIIEDTDKEANNVKFRVANNELRQIATQIIRLNKRIPACVNFPTEYAV